MIRREETLTVGDREVTVIELTVAEIRAWLEELSGGDRVIDLVDDLILADSFSLQELARMTDQGIDQLRELPPSHLRAIATRCQEVNADFFGLRDRLIQSGERLQGPASTD